jgi:hypothetical protein
VDRLARWNPAMFDDADKGAPAFNLPDADSVYRNYLETYRRAGVEPVPRERAQAPMAEWGAAIAAGRSTPPTKH